MISLSAFHIILIIFALIAVGVFILLQFVTAPYGFSSNKKMGVVINPRFGWILMEFPAPLLFAYYYFTLDSTQIHPTTGLVLFLLWEFHYFYRAFIYPFRTIGENKMSLTVAICGFLFQSVNTWLQAYWIYRLAPDMFYNDTFLASPCFIIGTIIFLVAIALNRQSDAILRKLRSDGSKEFKIPYGGLYTYISAPNYLSEFLTWVGWAILTWSLSGAVFALWTFSNLFPRALKKHEWYCENIPGYPKNRKAFFPFFL